MNGVIVIKKDKGMTSFDVVARMRKLAGTKKVGHTGTLDPDATGVLPVCIGIATKAADIMTGNDKKRYTALLRLGSSTDTGDASGNVISTGDASGITDEDIKKALLHFTGDIMQIPPMYSAIKVGGKKLYELARKGIEVERKERGVTIHFINMIKRDGSDVLIDVSCSKGTYIRTLCEDIGAFLSCPAHMANLERTESGNFTIDEAVSLDELTGPDDIKKHLKSTDALFDYPKYIVTKKQEWLLRNGVAPYCEGDMGKYKVFSENGDFLAISEITEIEGKLCLKTIKGFYRNE